MSLTINQEKQIRRQRIEAPDVRRAYHTLAGKVASYRRAQKLTQSKEASDLRKALLAEIDELLAKLGIRT